MNFSNLYKMARSHYLAIIFAFIIGLVIIAPQILFIFQAGNSYKGIYMFRADAELHYLARMNNGVNDWSLGNPFFDEKETTPTSFFTLSEILLALPAKIFGLSIPLISLIYKFLLPFILALLVYAFIFRLIKDKLWSLVGMFLIILGSTLFGFRDFVNLIKWNDVYGNFLIYNRPVNPQLSSILFFTYLHLLLSFIDKRTWKSTIWLTIIFGLSFYIYFYSFTFLFALNFIIFILFLIKKDFDLSRKLAVSSIVGAIAGVFTIINIVKMYNHQYYPAFAQISEITNDRAFVFSIAGIIIFLLFLFINYKRSGYSYKLLIFALLITTFLVVNQQVITGMVVQHGHYYWYFNLPIYAIVLTFSLYHLFNNRKGISITLAMILIVLSLADAILIQSSTYVKAYNQTVEDNEYMKVINWFKANDNHDKLIIANNRLSALIPVYTFNKVAWEDHASYYLLSEERRNADMKYFVSNLNNKEILNKYGIDYVVWDMVYDSLWNTSQSFLKEVYKDDRFKIYAYQD